MTGINAHLLCSTSADELLGPDLGDGGKEEVEIANGDHGSGVCSTSTCLSYTEKKGRLSKGYKRR
jgi:hypothetical protein